MIDIKSINTFIIKNAIYKLDNQINFVIEIIKDSNNIKQVVNFISYFKFINNYINLPHNS